MPNFNSKIHPDNPYFKKQPNIEVIAQKFPEFAKFTIPRPPHKRRLTEEDVIRQMGNGPQVSVEESDDDDGDDGDPVNGPPGEVKKSRLSFDFSTPEARRIFTQTLLKNDFNLKVTIPPVRLVPALTQRLNYLCQSKSWLDFAWNLMPTAAPPRTLSLIDVGCGASAIFPLLSAKFLKADKVVGFDCDAVCVECARSNVVANSLQDVISILKADDLLGALNQICRNDDEPLHFDVLLCNPPFFDIEECPRDRSGKRPLPPIDRITDGVPVESPTSCEATSDPVEVRVTGGEVSYVCDLATASANLPREVTIDLFTSMLGKKHSIEPIVAFLRGMPRRPSRIIMEPMYQGRVVRWLLAWTFSSSLRIPRDASLKQLRCLSPFHKSLVVPAKLRKNCPTRQIIQNVLEKAFSSLTIVASPPSTPVKRRDPLTWVVSANSDTWTNARSRRRGNGNLAPSQDFAGGPMIADIGVLGPGLVQNAWHNVTIWLWCEMRDQGHSFLTAIGNAIAKEMITVSNNMEDLPQLK